MLPPLRQNKAAIKLSQSNTILQKLLETRHSGMAAHSEPSPIPEEAQMAACYCITRPHCFVNVSSSVFDLISCCPGQCENPYQVHDPALRSL